MDYIELLKYHDDNESIIFDKYSISFIHEINIISFAEVMLLLTLTKNCDNLKDILLNLKKYW